MREPRRLCRRPLLHIFPTSLDPVFGGGAAGGFCTALCSTDGDCLSGGGVCYTALPGQPGRCTLSCEVGPALTGFVATLSPAKCLGRSDLRCVKVAEGVDECLPTCSGDDQCPDRVCDPETAVCVCPPEDTTCADQTHAGAPTGTPCDPSMVGACAGECIVFDQGYGMCSRPCVLGGASSDECGGPENGLCAFHPDANGAGDTGYCTSACTMPSDCLNPRFGCFTVPTLTDQSKKGYCFAAASCSHLPGDCHAHPGYVCTDTPSGPLCLDPAFLPADVDAGADASADANANDADEGEAGVSEAGVDAGDDAASDTDAGDAGASDADAGP